MSQLKVFVGQDRASKTEQMIDWLCGHRRRILLTTTRQECERLRKNFFFVAHRILPWEKRSFLRDSKIWEEVGIDDIDLLLRQEVHIPIGALGVQGEAYASQTRTTSRVEVAWTGVLKAWHTALEWTKKPEVCCP